VWFVVATDDPVEMRERSSELLGSNLHELALRRSAPELGEVVVDDATYTATSAAMYVLPERRPWCWITPYSGSNRVPANDSTSGLTRCAALRTLARERDVEGLAMRRPQRMSAKLVRPVGADEYARILIKAS